MKLNYVSVLREYKTKNREEGYYVRGEFESPPSTHWFNQLLLIWTSTPAYRKLCPEPQLNRNEMIITLPDGDNIGAAVEAIRSVVSRVKDPYINPEETHYLINVHEAIG